MLETKVVKRDGEVVNFDYLKIQNAIVKAATAVNISFSFFDLNKIVENIIEEISDRFSDNDFIINVENIHDIVEKHLMRSSHHEVAKSYIIYRAQKRQKENEDRKKISFLKSLNVKKKNGESVSFNPKKLKDSIDRHSYLLSVDKSLIFQETVKNVYNDMASEDIDKSLILGATSLIEQDPAYSTIAARFFRQRLGKEVFSKSTENNSSTWELEYRNSLKKSITYGISEKVFDSRLSEFDFDDLSNYLDLKRDDLLNYISIQTLYERYFAKAKGRRIEMPQVFWMRVAMGLAINEQDKNTKAKQFYDVMSQLLYVPSTPTLFHSGLTSPQLSSCYLSTVDDDLRNIFQTFSDNAQMSKWSGGIGNDWTNVRSTGSLINSTMVDSQGVIPFLKIANDVTVAINRSGKRRGATACYLETWHLDIEDFLDLRKNTGDERRRTHDMNTVNWIPDLFMKRVMENGKWTLFSPDEVPDLHHIYGNKFEEKYLEYEKMALEGKFRRFKVIEAQKLYRKMLTMLFETGHPWWCFKDACNIRSPQDHVGVVHNSNLCCIAADQLVVTNRGFFTVGEMYQLNEFEEFASDSWHLAGKKGIVNGSKMLLPRPNAPMRKIVTQEGFTHKVTPDHKVWVLDHGYKEAQDLIVGDKIELQTTNNVWGQLNCPDLAFICGLIASNGVFSDSSIYINISEKNSFILSEVEETVTNLIKDWSKTSLLKDYWNPEPKFAMCDNGKYCLSSSALFDILNHNGFNSETKSSFPVFVRRSNKETVKSYLRGLYSTNGILQIGEFTIGSICSTSLKLLETLQIIWINFGAKTTLTRMAEGNYCLIHIGIQACKILEEVTNIGNYRECELFLESIDKEDCTEIMYAIFERLEELPNEDAYCLEVDSEDHLWTVNGLLTKNTEITLNTKPTKRDDNGIVKELGEIAVCNLGSLNIFRHMFPTQSGWKVDWEVLKKTITVAIRMLDNVIDVNFYPVPEAKASNLRHRPIGLGYMGIQDALYMADIRYEEADDFVDELQEFISYHAIYSSSLLAEEKGVYESYKGSKWDRGIFPLDTISMLEQERGIPIEVDRKTRLDWKTLKERVRDYGLRNSNIMAGAPTATICNIAGLIGPCGEAAFANLYGKENMSGGFTVINQFLVEDLKKENLWDKEMLDLIKYHNGSVQKIDRIPLKLRTKYKVVWEIDQKRAIDLTALRGKWIDQSQSHNIFISHNSGKMIADLYMYAWRKGLKTTYYLRTLGASGIEKATLDAKYGLTQSREEVLPVKACKIDDPTCESCQ